jgi:DNA-directed RNA polymerase specialized sigma24 family protein
MPPYPCLDATTALVLASIPLTVEAVAYRMLGSLSEADDAVQEAWLRLSRSYTRAAREVESASELLRHH